jgi:hypothetical protein
MEVSTAPRMDPQAPAYVCTDHPPCIASSVIADIRRRALPEAESEHAPSLASSAVWNAEEHVEMVRNDDAEPE